MTILIGMSQPQQRLEAELGSPGTKSWSRRILLPTVKAS